MKVVVDTCCLVATLPGGVSHHWFWRAFRMRLFTLCVTTDMLEEYDEILTRRYGSVQARKVMRELTTAPNVKEVEVFFHWYLILDPDDNKFADCAFASNAAAIVTHDRHFNRLKYIEFPEIQVHTLDGLRTLLCGIEGGEDIFEW